MLNKSDPAQMDAAAHTAALELEALVMGDDERDKYAVERIAQWWADWYMKAGHKRLARALLHHAPERGEKA